jgi:hypothetical protein
MRGLDSENIPIDLFDPAPAGQFEMVKGDLRPEGMGPVCDLSNG